MGHVVRVTCPNGHVFPGGSFEMFVLCDTNFRWNATVWSCERMYRDRWSHQLVKYPHLYKNTYKIVPTWWTQTNVHTWTYLSQFTCWSRHWHVNTILTHPYIIIKMAFEKSHHTLSNTHYKYTGTNLINRFIEVTQMTTFMGPTWGPPGSCRPQMGPMLAPWTLLSGKLPLP